MARRRPVDDQYWDRIMLMVPYHFAAAAQEAAHRNRMPTLEWCRHALLLRLEADGVRIEDYADA